MIFPMKNNKSYEKQKHTILNWICLQWNDKFFNNTIITLNLNLSQ